MSRLTSFTHDGLTFNVQDSGPLDGPVVVLLHGFPQRASSWDAVVPILHAHGLRTIAPDQRGYSPGARPRGRTAYRSSKLVGDVVALIGAVGGTGGGGPVHLVGHDWGAVVAWATAAQHPELVRTLTAVSVPHPAAFLHALVTSRQLRDSWYMGLFQLPLVPERLVRRRPAGIEHALRAGGMSAAEVARFRTDIVEYGALTGGLNWYRALPFNSPRTTLLPVRVPTTHVWSDGDVAVGRRGAELCGRHVEAPYELVVLEGVSHWIPEHAPGPLADAILKRMAWVG